MKLISVEEMADADDVEKSDTGTTTCDCNERYVKSDLEKSNKGCMSSESTARRSLQKINTMVVTSGISSCRMGVESSETCDLSNMLKNLDLKDATDVKAQKSENWLTQLKEEDDKGDVQTSAGRRAGEKKNNEEIRATDNLVKLEPPPFDDKEGDEVEQSGREETQQSLGERGPMYGVPSSFVPETGHSNVTGMPTSAYGLQNSAFISGYSCSAMPANFPNYGLQDTWAVTDKGFKRGVEDQVYWDCQGAPKYVRPQMCQFSNTAEASSGAGTVSGKIITCVYKSQLSGGTVSENISSSAAADQVFNGNLDNLAPPYITNFLDLPSNQASFTAPMNGQFPLGLDSVTGYRVKGQMPNAQACVDLNQRPLGYSQQYPVTSSGTFTDTLNFKEFENCQQKVMHKYQGAGSNEKRFSYGNTSDDNSDGYGSDSSLFHESQTSPPSSPPSVAVHWSPPRSPPPSNMSSDSGVGSPLPEDLNICLAQISSKLANVKSPKSMTAALGTSHLTKMMSSPPPQHPCMIPPQPAKMPHQDLTVPAPHTLIKQQGVTVALSRTLMSQTATSAGQQICPLGGPSNAEEYVDPYVSENLEDLHNAYEVIGKDLLAKIMHKKLSVIPPPEATPRDARIACVNDSSSSCNENTDGVISRNIQPALTKPVVYMDKAVGRNAVRYPAVIEKLERGPNVPTVVPPTIGPVNTNIATNCPGSFVNGQMNITPIGNIHTSSGNIHTSNGNIHTSNGNILTSNGNILTSSGNIHTSSGNILTSNGNILTPSGNSFTQVTSLPGTFVITTSSRHLPVNNQGKVGIPPVTQKPKFPVLVTGPIIIVQPNVPSKTSTGTKPRPIAPKDPAKQVEKPEEANPKPASGQRVSSCEVGRSNLQSRDIAVTEKNRELGLLNLARRVVAEMPTIELKCIDEDGDAYLHIGVCQREKHFVQALLERNDREELSEMINRQNYQGQTPLYLAVSTNNAEIVCLLVEHGADVSPLAESVTSAGVSEKQAAIHCASTKGEEYLDTLKALLKAPGIDLNLVDSNGHTALHCAIHSHGRMRDRNPINSIPIIQALLRAGADPNLQVQQSGKTALMYALESRDLDLIESTFSLVDPCKLAGFLKTQAYDSSTCLKIAESLKATLDVASQHRLNSCLRPGNSRGSSSYHHLS